MPSIHRWFRWMAVALIGVAGPLAGQNRATLEGRVLDTTGNLLADAEVVVTLASDTTVVKQATTNAKGVVVIRDLAPGGPYTLLARKIGYGAARGGDVHLKAKDTLRVDFELPAMGVTLPTITVRGRRGSSTVLTAEDFDPEKYPDALNAIAWKRPYMLGDPNRCSNPPTPPWPVPASSRSLGRRPWVNDSRFFDVFNPPYSPLVQRVYVNGRRVDVPGISPLVTLHEIPSEQIAEMRYVDCAEYTDAWPYSIYIVLKAPSREIQDSILESIMRGKATP